jgi:thioesterase DpgC
MSKVDIHLARAAGLERWLAGATPAVADAQRAASDLSRQIDEGERLLAELPAKSERNAAEQDWAGKIHHCSRALRESFMQSHAQWVYDRLTANRSTRPALTELVYAASLKFPGLVPTHEQIARERTHLQCDKEAREIDQGIFFAGILASPECGLHLLESMLAPSARALSLLQQFQQSGELRLEAIHLERRGQTAHLTVHNQACLNAEDDGLIANMETAVDLVLLDDAVRVCVLRGGTMTHPKYAGRRVFSAGINLRQLHQGQISFVEFLLQRELGYISKMLRGLRVGDPLFPGLSRTVEKPWIAAVDSFAIGGGAQLLLVCDHVIGAADSFFSLPAAQEGIVPGVANLRLTRATGARVARQIILGGRRIWAQEPDGRLLFDEIAEPANMDAAIEAGASRLSSPAVIANRHMLALAEEPLPAFRQYLAGFARQQAERMYSPDVLEKVGRA